MGGDKEGREKENCERRREVVVLLSRVSLEIEYAEVKIRRSGGAKPLEEITGGQITIRKFY
jgi:hypothetical protein